MDTFEAQLVDGQTVSMAQPSIEAIPGGGYYGLTKVRMANGHESRVYVQRRHVGLPDEPFHAGGEAHRFETAAEALKAAEDLCRREYADAMITPSDATGPDVYETAVKTYGADDCIDDPGMAGTPYRFVVKRLSDGYEVSHDICLDGEWGEANIEYHTDDLDDAIRFAETCTSK